MKCVIWTKRNCLTAMLCCLIVALTVAVATSGVKGIAAAARLERAYPIYCVQKEEPVIGLSFDVVWSDEEIQQIIDILGHYQVKATFFVVGDWAGQYPQSVRALAAAGHEVQNGSNTHPHMAGMGQDAMLREINACNDNIEHLTGIRPTLFRPPFGEYDDALMDALGGLHMQCVLWDADSLDWKNLTSAEITAQVADHVQNGSILRLHTAAKNMPEALPAVLERLRSDGYRLAPVSQILLPGRATVDRAGRQIPLS